MTGRFIQAGATPPGKAIDGYGEFVTVERLDDLERTNVRRRMDHAKPAMFADGVRIARAKIDADNAIEALRRELVATVGVDGVRSALAMMTDEAIKQASQDAKRAQSESGKAPAIKK